MEPVVVIEAIGLALQIIALFYPEDADEDTVITYGNVISGTGWYNWIDENNLTSTVDGDFFLTNIPKNGQMLFRSEHLNIIYVGETTGSGTAPTLEYAPLAGDNWRYQWSGGSFYTLECVWDGGNTISANLAQIITNDFTSVECSYYGFSRLPRVCHLSNLTFITNSDVHNDDLSVPYVPAGNYNFDQLRTELINWGNDYILEQDPTAETIPYDSPDIPTWEDLNPTEPTESTEPTEPTEPATGDGNGSIIINNYDNATMNVDNTISGDADVDIFGKVDAYFNANSIGAGAFGAGAFADVDVNVNAGAFGAGAFGAGALGQVDVNGEVIINGNAITMNGGSIANNYYTIESGANVELPSYPAIDYDEILSERELESILTQETYYIPELETDFLSLELMTLPPAEPLPERLTQLSAVVAEKSTGFLDDFGVSAVYTPLAIVTIACFILRGGK